jgi:hypothetical protein
VRLLPQQGQKRGRQANRAQQIYGDDGLRIGRRLRLRQEIFHPHNPRVIDQDIQARIVRRQPICDRPDACRILHIEFNRSHPRAGGGGRIERLFTPARHDDFVSERVERLRQTEADAAPAARDEDCVARRFHTGFYDAAAVSGEALFRTQTQHKVCCMIHFSGVSYCAAEIS